MWMGVISLFPEMFERLHGGGVVGRTLAAGRIEFQVFNPRDETTDRHATVDDRPYGGGPGMVMMAEPCLRSLARARSAAPPGSRALLLSPQGERFDQVMASRLARLPGLILFCGRYEGVDERLAEACDGELSLGDFVVSGGEIPALAVIDAVARLIPGTLGNAASIIDESHLDDRLDYPHYTRPETVDGQAVPPVLLSGDHGAVSHWRRREALRRTYERRPDLLTRRTLTEAERKLLGEVLSNSP